MAVGIGIFVGVLIVGIYVLVGVGLVRREPPEDDWAPIEAVFGRKFLSRTARSLRRRVRDPEGKEHLIEATRSGGSYSVRIDGRSVQSGDIRSIEAVLDNLESDVAGG